MWLLVTCEQTLVTYENIRVQRQRKKYLSSSRDKESDGTQFLLTENVLQQEK